jgi:hypothetical protein
MSELKIVEKLFKGRHFDCEVIVLCVRALVQIPSTRKHSLLRCADFRPKAPRSRLQVQLGLERPDVPV